MLRWSLVATCLFALGCGGGKVAFKDRAPGERKPLSAMCDPMDPLRCGLPWPSNTFTVADSSTATGLRLALDNKAVPLRDDVTLIDRFDGFSRLTPIATGFAGTIDPNSVGVGDSLAIALYVAQPGAPDEGQKVPLTTELFPSTSPSNGEQESLLIGYPAKPLAPNSDHVVVVFDSLKFSDGTQVKADHLTRVALGLDKPANDDEEARAAYHAPTRTLLKKAGVDFAHVARVWDFTTRGKDDAKTRLQSMQSQLQSAVDAHSFDIALDSVNVPDGGSIAAVVTGRLTNLPDFRTDAGTLSLDASGTPVADKTHDAPFRVMIPQGSGDYRICLFGHGTGGSYIDDSFDNEIATAGMGKVSALFYGWDGNGVINTFLGLSKMLHGVEVSSAGLMQAMADFSAVERALNGPLGDALSQPTLMGTTNPAAGRKPNAKEPIWTGGSLGGTMGLVYAGASANVKYAVLNVPGAGWTHFVPGSDMYELIRPGLMGNYPTPLDFRYALIVSQLLWDDIDGGNWNDDMASDGSVYLVQDSIGDSILPNIGSNLVATTVNAIQIGAVLSPVPGLSEDATSVDNRSGFTQFHTADTSAFGKHGFAARSGPAGDAARAQISAFLTSVLAGAPHIEVPPTCVSNTVPNSCDFSQ